MYVCLGSQGEECGGRCPWRRSRHQEDGGRKEEKGKGRAEIQRDPESLSLRREIIKGKMEDRERKGNGGKGSEFVHVSVRVCRWHMAGGQHAEPAVLCKPPRASSKFNIVVRCSLSFEHRKKLFAYNLL